MLDFKKDYTLTDNAVIIRPLSLADTSELIKFSLSEPTLWTYSLMNAHGKDALEQYIHHALKQRNLEKEYPFVVLDKTKYEVAGTTRFYNLDAVNKIGCIGYTWYGKKFHGSGLNKHCKFLLLDFAFTTLALQRVEFRTDAKNTQSIEAIKSIGAQQEGILRSNAFNAQGGRRDTMVFSILQTEWEQHLRSSLSARLASIKY